PTLAPTSSRTVNPRRLGRTAAMAGRSTPGSTPMTNIEMAMAAPVLPAGTKAAASPSRTSSAAERREEAQLAASPGQARSGHAHHLRGVADVEMIRRPPGPGHLALDGRLVAHEDDRGPELAGRRHRAFHHDGRTVIAPHGVDGDLHARRRATSPRWR